MRIRQPMRAGRVECGGTERDRKAAVLRQTLTDIERDAVERLGRKSFDRIAVNRADRGCHDGFPLDCVEMGSTKRIFIPPHCARVRARFWEESMKADYVIDGAG